MQDSDLLWSLQSAIRKPKYDGLSPIDTISKHHVKVRWSGTPKSDDAGDKRL
jgi:hypothetical protein